MGVTEKKLMWAALSVARLLPSHTYNFEQLQRRAEKQVQRIEAERIPAICKAFAGAIRSK